MKKTLAATAAILCLAAGTFAADEKEKSSFSATDENKKVSYAIGIQVADSLDLPGFEVDLEAFIAGLEDRMKDREPAMTQEEIQTTMMSFQSKMQAAMAAERNKEGSANLEAGQAFLDAKAKEEGVKVTESGLQYKVLKEGSGPSPKATDEVTVHYTGTLINGEKFDSSVDRGEPATFQLNQVISGWTEGLQLMKTGAKYQFYIPADLAYGENGRPSIPPNSVLVFDVELLEVKSTVELPTGVQ